MAVKVQYPGVGEAIEADLRNTNLFGAVLAAGFQGFDPAEMVAEIKERVHRGTRLRARGANQQRFADFYRDHPFVSVPAAIDALCTSKVLTCELVTGDTWPGADVGPAPARP